MPQGDPIQILDVPFIRQLEGGNGHKNCGPAATGETLVYYGKGPATQDFMHDVACKVRGNSDPYADTETGLADWQRGLSAYGVGSNPVTTWGDISAALTAGNPVIIAVQNRLFDRPPYPRRSGFLQAHIVVLTGQDPAFAYINDSLAYPGVAKNWGIGKTAFPRAALAMGSSDGYLALAVTG